MKLIQWREDEKGEGEFKKEGGKKINWLMNYISLFSPVFSFFAAQKIFSVTNFPPFSALIFKFNSIEYSNKLKD